MRRFAVWGLLLWAAMEVVVHGDPPLTGLASWYGAERRGKVMADGQPFDPDKLTGASWFYPLGTKIRVSATGSTNTVEVTITDRGPAQFLVRQGRILDLSRGAFERLADPDKGLVRINIEVESEK